MSVPCSHPCILRTGEVHLNRGGSGSNISTLHISGVLNFHSFRKYPVWACELVASHLCETEMLQRCSWTRLHPFSSVQSDLIHFDAWAYLLKAKQSTGWEFNFKRPLPIWAGIEMCDAAAGPRSPSHMWTVQCSPDTKKKMQEPSSQFIKSLLTQIDSSASVIDVNQIWIHEHRVNIVAGSTLRSYSVWLFLKKFGFKGHKIALDFRQVLGSEPGLAVGIIGLSPWILTIKLESLILLHSGCSGLSPAKHSGWGATFNPRNGSPVLSRVLGLALGAHSMAVVGNHWVFAGSVTIYLRAKLF